MPRAPDTSRHNPSFLRFPLNNARTGFQPVFLPLVLIEPHRRNADGVGIADSLVQSARFFIAEAPDPARVAGPFNTQLLVPDTDRFTLNISKTDLSQVQVNPAGQVYFGPDGSQIDESDASEGDFFQYDLMQNMVRDQVPFLIGANYYDLSSFLIDVEDLPRPERYLFVWEVTYFNRTVSANDEFLCIDTSDLVVAQFRIEINHPGEVHHEMFRRTPPLYFTSTSPDLADEPVLQFYRPFADALQDIFDEQGLIDGINHIDKIPAQLIPYLAFLIGWDLPNFPGVSDSVRRSILERGVKLQKLKGSRRAIIELFDILGFSIDILNLWTATDGSQYIAPGESLPPDLSGQEIDTETVCQIEPLVSEFDDPGFGQAEVPLVHRPISNITLESFLVTDSSDTDVALKAIADAVTDDPAAFESGSCVQNSAGFLIPQKLIDDLPIADPGLLSSAQVLLDRETGRAIDDLQSGSEPPISSDNIIYNVEQNVINLVFDHHFDFESNTKIYVFAVYNRAKITVPEALENTRSNRFDIRILLRNNESPSDEVLEFLLNFLFKLKAFHSLLRKIIFTKVVTEVYNVQDFCLGGEVQQDPRFEAGTLQVPPPVDGFTVATVGDCDPDVLTTRGFKPEDIALRNDIINGLKEEHAAWKLLDGTHTVDLSLQSLSNIQFSLSEGEQCQFTQLGQDRVEFQDQDFDHNDDNRPKVCDITVVPLPDNCFKGRVDAQLETDNILLANEKFRCKPCSLGLGVGTYWTIPSVGLEDLGQGSQTRSRFLGRRLRQYNNPTPDSIHFNNRLFFDPKDLATRFLAIDRPSLCIEKESLGFPGHRFITMSNLEEDFISTDHRGRPWDDEFSLITCDRNLIEENPLNAEIVENSDGVEVISFDDADLTYFGNGIEPDVSSFGEHENRDFLVTHKIFSSTSEGHPSITLDQTVITTETEIEFDSSTEFDPLFKSFNSTCNKDFIDGYPAETGRFDVDIESIDFDRDSSTGATDPDPLSELLGIPASRTGTDITALFTFGSGILLEETDPLFRFHQPFRLDCDCGRFECDQTGATTTPEEPELNLPTCLVDTFRENGFFDSRCDKLETDISVVLNENLGTCSTLLDGTIPNMLCQLVEDSAGAKIVPIGSEIPSSGSLFFIDDYDIHYNVDFIREGNRIDITTTTKQPRVWGEDPSGFVTKDDDGRRLVFRDGIITTCRQILEIQDDGSHIIIGEGCDQKVDLYQSNIACGDRRPADDFCFRLDCQVVDRIELQVTCGPRWADPDEPEDTCVEWGGVDPTSGDVVSGSGIQTFAYIDVWGPDTSDISCVPCVATTGVSS